MNVLGDLPVPEIVEETVFQQSFTLNSKKIDNNRLCPPKLRTRFHDGNFNRTHASTLDSNAQARPISFRSSSSVRLSRKYNESLNISYFEQCFTNISKLGEGSFGEVFKVRSKEDGLCYAVKKSKQFYRSEQYRQERLEEVRRYEQFSGHANCLRFYQAWEEDDRLYMQMELCQESLECYAERNFPVFIPEKKIWSILLDLLLALKSLHDKNLIHLDIKLDNVLIADDGTCKLADFGLVIDVDRANRCQATEGDSRYMAPEIMQGRFSKAADIFSLGIAMLELSCYLKLPSNGPLWQQLRGGYLPEDFIKKISPELCAIIRQMMTPNPLERPSVNSLLAQQKFITMLKNRNRWNFGKTIQRTLRSSYRLAQTLICAVKSIALSVLNSMRSKLMFSKSERALLSAECTPKQAPSLNRSFRADDTPYRAVASFSLAYQSTPICNGNATPISVHTSFRSRKDLTRTSFGNNSSDLESSSDFSSRLLCVDDKKTSSVCGKVLFKEESSDETD